MTQENKITPEYIVEQSKILSDVELLELIEEFGYQKIEEGENSAFGDFR